MYQVFLSLLFFSLLFSQNNPTMTISTTLEITPEVTTLAGSGSLGSADGTGTAASFDNPSGVAVDGSGNVYVGDQSNNMIRKITSAGDVTTFAGSTSSGSADGNGTSRRNCFQRSKTYYCRSRNWHWEKPCIPYSRNSLGPTK